MDQPQELPMIGSNLLYHLARAASDCQELILATSPTGPLMPHPRVEQGVPNCTGDGAVTAK